MNLVEKMICAAAEYEVQQIKESRVEFVLDKSIFNPCNAKECFYGQKFGNSKGPRAAAFKKSNNIITGFCSTVMEVDMGIEVSALESLTGTLWKKGKKEQVYKIVEQFATWTNGETITENLYTV